MSTAIAGKRLSKRPVERDDRQRARQSKAHPDCRSTTIKSRLTKISLALSSGRDNHPPAATAEMAILIVAVFPSRLSRYMNSLAWTPNDPEQPLWKVYYKQRAPDFDLRELVT